MADNVLMFEAFLHFCVVTIANFLFVWLFGMVVITLMITLMNGSAYNISYAVNPSNLGFIPIYVYSLAVIFEIAAIYMLYKTATYQVAYYPEY